MGRTMRNFDNWLFGRDRNLYETMSRENMSDDDMDALKAAHRQAKEEDELEEKARSIRYLANIKKKIEGWVDSHRKGTKSLKFIAAALVNHAKTKEGIRSNLRQVYNHEFKNLKDLQHVFSHESLIKHLTNIDSLHALNMIVNSDFDDQLLSLEKDPMHHKTDHSHGDLGKKFANFVVSHIKHATDDVLGILLGGHHNKEDDIKDKPESPEKMDAPSPEGADQFNMANAGGPQSQDANNMNAAPPPPQIGQGGQNQMGMMPDDPMGANPQMGGDPQMGANPQMAGSPQMGANPQMGGDTTTPSDQNSLMPPVGMAGQRTPPQGQPPQGQPPQGTPPQGTPPAPPMM